MAQLSTIEQRELNKLIKENESIQSRIDGKIKIQNKTLEKQEQIQKRILSLETKRDAMSQDQRDVLKESNKLLDQLDKKERILALSADKYKSMKSKTLTLTQNTLAFLTKQNKNSKYGNELLQKSTDLYSDITNSANDLESIKSMENDLQASLNQAIEDGNKGLETHYNLGLKILEAKKDEVEHIDDSETGMSGLDDLMGGFLSKSLTFLKKSPIAKSLAIAVAMMAILKQGMEEFAKVADAIGQSFGAYGLQEFGPQLGMAAAKAKMLGYEVEDVNNIVKTLNSSFGFTIQQSTDLVGTVTNMSKALGVSVDEGATLLSLFGQMSGNSAETAEEIISTVNELAKIEGIAPNAVLSDIANNAEFFAKFSKEGGRNVAETALQARKLGLSLSTVEGMMSDSTDIAGSLSKEYEAELFLQKDISMEKLRQLKVNGSASEILSEQRKILEDINFLGIDDRLTREKVADLLGASVADLTKIATKQKESVVLQKKLKDMTFKELIGKDAQDGLTTFNNSMDTLGAILTQNIMPPLSFVAGLFGSLVNFLTESAVGMAVLTGAATTLGVILAGLAVRGVAMAIAGAFSMITGFIGMGPLGLIAGMAAIGGFVNMLRSNVASPPTPPGLAEGGVVKATPGGMQATIGEGGEAEAVIPLSKMGSLVNVDMTPMSKEIATLKVEMAKTNAAMHTLIANMDNYFGFGGTAVKGIGRETIKAGTSLI